MFEMRSHPVKGRGLYATRLIRGGEIVIEDEPVLAIASPDHAHNTCCICMRLVSGAETMTTCGGCNQAVFCDESCKQMGISSHWLHGTDVCNAYRALQGRGLGAEDQATLRFLVHALSLREARSQDSLDKYQQLLSLCGTPTVLEMHTIGRLSPILADLLGCSANPSALGTAEELASLLRKDQLNSYGLLASVLPEEDEARKKGSNGRILRGSGVYALASMINHECNPNVCRFDPGFPAASPSVHPARLSFRAMHDLPAGSEITQSYCPLDWTFEERQGQCREVYGFTCNCPRCQLEATEVADDDAMDEGGDTSTSRIQDEDIWGGQGPYSQLPPNADEGPLEAGYLDVFLLKFLCPQTFTNGVACSGTMAPEAPADSPEASVLECNVCGFKRTEADFLRELEESSRQ